MPNSPTLFGPNSKGINLQEGLIQPSGIYNQFNGRKNYITLGDFENGLATGWNAVGIASLTNGLPTSVGSGGTAFTTVNGGSAVGVNTTAPAVVSSGQLSGLYSLNLATSGAGTIGDMYISNAYNIDISDQAKVLNISFNYKVITGTPNLSGTSVNTYAVAVYDLVTNAWLPVVGAFNLVQSTGVGIFTGTIQTNSNTVGLQLAVYSPVAPTAASSLYLDDFFLGRTPVATGASMSDWVSYTPTFVGLGTVSSPVTYWRRDGDTLEVVGKVVSGTSTAVAVSISLPSGLVGDGNKFAASSQILGEFQGLDGAAVWTQSAGAVGWVFGNSANPVNVNLALASASTTTLGASLGNALISSGQSITFKFRIPIVGWSSNTVQSSDSLQQVVASQLTTLSSTTITSGTALAFTTTTYDQTGSLSGGTTFIAPVSGFYDVSVGGIFTSAASINLNLNVNGSSRVANMITLNATIRLSASAQVKVNAGDTITLSPGASGTAGDTNGWVVFKRVTGPAVVQATESVNARYTATSTTPTGSFGAVVFSTKDFDSHSAYSAGTYTIPVSGKYNINSTMQVAAVTMPASSNNVIAIFKNGTQVDQMNYLTPATMNGLGITLQIVDTISCLAGDLITIRVIVGGTTPAITGASTSCSFSISRVGN